MSKNIWYQKEIKEMINSFAKASTFKEIESLMGVINTPREINDMAKRHKIKTMLEAGKSYTEIIGALEVSPSIISRVSQGVGYGFRRSNSIVAEKPKKKVSPEKKRYLKYKGIPIVPINRKF